MVKKIVSKKRSSTEVRRLEKLAKKFAVVAVRTSLSGMAYRKNIRHFAVSELHLAADEVRCGGDVYAVSYIGLDDATVSDVECGIKIGLVE